jgi:integrase
MSPLHRFKSMPKPKPTPLIRCEFFRWRLRDRAGVFYADGRGNHPPLGKHSLGTRDRNEAQRLLPVLDQRMAVKLGLVPQSILARSSSASLPLADGRQMFEKYSARPTVAGGVQASSQRRYRASLDNFIAFCDSSRVTTWNAVDHRVLQAYAAHVEQEGRAQMTLYNEVTLVKQVVKWLIGEGMLGEREPIRMKLAKPVSQPAYCWRAEEVEAILKHCLDRTDLQWLYEVVLLLAHTGLRISEAVAVRWSDLDLEAQMLTLTDESGFGPRAVHRRRLKSGRSRTIPLHQQVLELLETKCDREGILLRGPDGNPLDPKMVRKSFINQVIHPLLERFPERQGERSFRDGRLHSFRHYFCSTCANQGVAERALMSWLGHANSDMIRIYYKLHDDESLRQLSSINFISDSPGVSGDGKHKLKPQQERAAKQRVNRTR